MMLRVHLVTRRLQAVTPDGMSTKSYVQKWTCLSYMQSGYPFDSSGCSSDLQDDVRYVHVLPHRKGHFNGRTGA